MADADDLKAIEGLTGTSGLLKKTAANTWTLDTTAYKTGTVTSIATGTGLTGGTITSTGTISLADNYGDTKNPYASKTARYVLAAPASAAGVPSFRALTNADVGLGNVENTKLSTWTGSGNITTIGTLSSGTVPWARLSGVPSTMTPSSHTHGNITNDGKIGTAANQAAYTTTNGVVTAGTLPAAAGGTGKTTLKDAANALINALDTGSSNLTLNDYVITQYVGGGTTTTTYHRRPASALRVGGLLTARKLTIGSTGKNFDGTGDVSWTLAEIGAAASNHNHDSSYVNVDGDTMSGALLIGTKAMTVTGGKITEIGNGQTGVFKDGIAISNPATKNDAGWIRVTGTGESDTVMEIATGDDAGAGEKIVARQYNTSNAVANELILLNTDGGTVIPKRLTMTSGKPVNQILTGSGTAAKDAGADTSPRYTPAKWTFNTGLTVTNGDIFTIKIPIAGHSYGVFMSVNNGTNYYPVVLNGTGRVTTHYPVNTYIQVVFESTGSAASMTPLAGADTANSSTITGGVFRVLNYYDSNTTYSAMSAAEIKAGTATSSRVIRADYLKSAFTASDGVFKTGSSNGTISVYGTDIAVKGLGSAAYTASTAYAASGHTHTTTIATSSGTNQLTLAFGTKYAITAGGTSYIFTTPANPNTDIAVKQSNATADKWRKVTLGSQYFDNINGAVTEQTGQLYINSQLEFNTSAGTLKATEYSVNGNVTLEYNSTTESLDFVF